MHGYGRQTRFSKSAWRIGPLIDACLVGMWRRRAVSSPTSEQTQGGKRCLGLLVRVEEPNMLNQRYLRLNLRPAQPLQLSSHLSTQLSTLDTLSEDGCQGR
jgi:hypothetical protein